MKNNKRQERALLFTTNFECPNSRRLEASERLLLCTRLSYLLVFQQIEFKCFRLLTRTWTHILKKKVSFRENCFRCRAYQIRKQSLNFFIFPICYSHTLFLCFRLIVTHLRALKLRGNDFMLWYLKLNIEKWCWILYRLSG